LYDHWTYFPQRIEIGNGVPRAFVPNRNIANVSRFPHGGVYAYADIQAPREADQAKMRKMISGVAIGLWNQFREIILEKPAIGKLEMAEGGDWNYLRMRFKIWPGQQSLIETTLRQQITSSMKAFDASYADWMVTVTYRASITVEDDAPSLKPELRNGQLSSSACLQAPLTQTLQSRP